MNPDSCGTVGQRMDMTEKVHMWLITQRSKVQIIPPQPTDSTATYSWFRLHDNRHNFKIESRKSLIRNSHIGDSLLGCSQTVPT